MTSSTRFELPEAGRQARASLVLLALAGATLALPACNADSRAANADRAVMAQLKAAGSDFSKPHEIDFFLYLPDREAAERASLKVQKLGLAVKVEPGETESEWVVLGTKTMLPREPELAAIGDQLTEIATADGGEYDGWGAAVVQ